MSNELQSFEYESFIPLRDRKRAKCLSCCRATPILIVLLLQLLTVAALGYIAFQLAPLKTQVEPLISKSSAIAAKINATTFPLAVNRASAVVSELDMDEFTSAIGKASDVLGAVDVKAIAAASRKTTDVISSINTTAFLQSIDNIERIVVPSLIRLLPVLESNVMPTFVHLQPVLNKLPYFINETETFMAQVRAFFKHVSSQACLRPTAPAKPP